GRDTSGGVRRRWPKAATTLLSRPSRWLPDTTRGAVMRMRWPSWMLQSAGGPGSSTAATDDEGASRGDVAAQPASAKSSARTMAGSGNGTDGAGAVRLMAVSGDDGNVGNPGVRKQ